MANTTITYNNPNRPNANKVDNSNRFKINNAALNMMARNPSLGIGYIIGSMLGENYWGNKRNKSSQEAVDDFNKKHGIGADANGVYGVNNGNGAVKYQGRQDVDWDSMNKALDNIPRTPQQANKPAVTTENAGTTGGVPTVADAWNNMVNGSVYNPGNTALFTNGARNMGNVIGADANGEFGRMAGLHPGVIIDTARGIYPAARPGTYIDTSRGIYMDSSQNTPAGGSAPSAANIPRSPQTKAPNPNPTPIPYTAEQLAQIQAQGYSPEELRRMGAAELIAPPPTAAPASAPASVDTGLLASAAANAASSTLPPASPAEVLNPLSEDRDHEPYYANQLSEADDHDLQNLAINNSNQQRSLNWLKRKQMEEPKTYSIDVNSIFNALKPANDPYSNILKKRR